MQSFVTFGHVGNSASVFPLQYRGVDVSPLHTLQFSTHPLYSFRHAGSKMQDDDISQILQKLLSIGEECAAKNGHPLITHVLSGYIGDVQKIEALAKYVEAAKKLYPRTFYFCDPVCGDNGKLYVAPEVVQAIREHLLPRADAIKPNAFEVKMYTGIDIVDVASALRAAVELHRMGPRIVVISSFSVVNGAEQQQHDAAAAREAVSKKGYALLSWVRPRTAADVDQKGGDAHFAEEALDGLIARSAETSRMQEYHVVEFDLVDGQYSGTGDVFSSLVLSELALRGEGCIDDAFQRTVRILVALINDTKKNSDEIGGQKEMRLVAMRHLFDLLPSTAHRNDVTENMTSNVRDVIKGTNALPFF